ncbi:hypothetical protein R3P38DRAFT_1363202 [Favolaschia claudopus]|uniref:Uncharacterized protein n=1 Tax=Favolaschia claudopus TaxID=2862362 RepID=A0AAW0DVY8_9AGAR
MASCPGWSLKAAACPGESHLRSRDMSLLSLRLSPLLCLTTVMSSRATSMRSPNTIYVLVFRLAFSTHFRFLRCRRLQLWQWKLWFSVERFSCLKVQLFFSTPTSCNGETQLCVPPDPAISNLHRRFFNFCFFVHNQCFAAEVWTKLGLKVRSPLDFFPWGRTRGWGQSQNVSLSSVDIVLKSIEWLVHHSRLEPCSTLGTLRPFYPKIMPHLPLSSSILALVDSLHFSFRRHTQDVCCSAQGVRVCSSGGDSKSIACGCGCD